MPTYVIEIDEVNANILRNAAKQKKMNPTDLIRHIVNTNINAKIKTSGRAAKVAWTKEEIELLKELWEKRCHNKKKWTLQVIAERLDRKLSSVYNKATELGLMERKPHSISTR